MGLTAQDNNIGFDSTVECIGDSLTAGAGSSNGDTYPKLLNVMLGINDRIVNNQGIGGQTYQQIAGRIGALPIKLTATGGQAGIGDTAVTNISNTIGSTAADIVQRFYSGNINGSNVVLTRVPGATIGSQDSYVVKSADGAAITVSNSYFVPDNLNKIKPRIQVLWLGRNNVPDFTGLVDTYATAVDNMTSPKRVIILGVLNSMVELNNSTGQGLTNYNSIITINNTLRSIYGARFVEMTPPTTEEMIAIDYTPITQDATDIALGIFPATMHADNTHLNSIGYKIVALRVYRKFIQFGW